MKTNLMSSKSRKKSDIIFLSVFIVVCYILLNYIQTIDFSMFHIIVELLAVFMAFLIFIFMLGLWKYIQENALIVIIGLSFFFVAFIDIFHILSYRGVSYFVNYDSNLPTQLWIFARYFQAISFLLAVLMYIKKKVVNTKIVTSIFLLVTVIGLILIFNRLFPNSYIEGVGLTNFKVISEYIIALIFIASFLILAKYKFPNKDVKLWTFFVAIILQALSELLFTTYVGVFDFSNFLGHYFKFLSMIFIFLFLFRIIRTSPDKLVFLKTLQNEKNLQEAINIDVLTNLYNRRKFNSDELLFYTADYLPLAYIMGDINGLKVINDSYGHKMGDDAIVLSSKVIGNNIPKKSSLYRIGGDEFVIILPNTTVSEIDSIIKKVEEEMTDIEINGIPLSISFGYSIRNSMTENLDEAYQVAENKMYNNKSSFEESRHGDILRVILNSLFEKNPGLERHTNRVASLCVDFAEYLGFKSDQIRNIKSMALLHDIGKIAIEEELLNKVGKLTKHEMEIIYSHPEIGFRIINSVKSYSHIANVILHHHERYDGTGYPSRLKGNDIPYMSRIISICDSYDAMTSERTYRTTFTKEQALKELSDCSGTQFDPDLAQKFIELKSNI